MEEGRHGPDTNWDDYSNNLCYLNGTSAMIQNSGSVYAAMKDKSELLEKTWIVASPAGPKGKASFTNYSQWNMKAKSQNAELAKKFFTWDIFTRGSGNCWHVAGESSPVQGRIRKELMWEDPYLKGFMENSLVTHTAGSPGPDTLGAGSHEAACPACHGQSHRGGGLADRESG